MQYRPLCLLIDGASLTGDGRDTIDVINPSTEERLGLLPVASEQDVNAAIDAAQRAFADWSTRSPYERARLLRRAAELLRERAPRIAELVCLEQGKGLHEAMGEVKNLADIVEWDAEEGRRAYGRTIPSRTPMQTLHTVLEPVGPVAAFTPWNYPALLPLRKISAILAAGCTCIIKPAEETPASALEVAQAFLDAGLPAGALNVVYGAPARTSSLLIASEAVRAVTFTGSTEVGRVLATLCGQSLKRSVMELGGHAPVIVMDDVPDVEALARAAATRKFKNAAQGCVNPGRFYVHDRIFDRFVAAFAERAQQLRVGDAAAPDVDMGPVLSRRRLDAMAALSADALAQGAHLVCGGERLPGKGWFWPPTVLKDVPEQARLMNEEIFGPIVPINRFSEVDEAIRTANRLQVGLAAYAFTSSLALARRFERELEAGMVGLNTFSLGVPDSIASPETPFGGIKSSGFGSEGGTEGLMAFLNTKLVSTFDQP